MTEKRITLEEALKLVEFEFAEGEWRVVGVKTNVGLYVWGTIYGFVLLFIADVIITLGITVIVFSIIKNN